MVEQSNQSLTGNAGEHRCQLKCSVVRTQNRLQVGFPGFRKHFTSLCPTSKVNFCTADEYPPVEEDVEGL